MPTVTILLTNLKGGVGKTTIANEVAFGLSRRGYRVSLVTLDPQGDRIYPDSTPGEDDDFLVVDTPPTLDDGFKDWCADSDIILIPTQASQFQMAPLSQCHGLAREFGGGAKVGVVVNYYDHRRRIDREFDVYLEGESYDVWGRVPFTTALGDAHMDAVSIYDRSRKSRTAAAFEELCDRIVREAGNA